MSAKILIVDDNPADALIISSLVTQEGALAVTAANGHDALDLLHEEQFTAIIVDLQMPFMGGFELIKRIRRSESGPHLPVLVSSGRSDSANISQAIKLGANDYMVKPVDPVLFSEKFKRLLGSDISWQEYRPVKNSEYKIAHCSLPYQMIGLSEVGITLLFSYRPEAGQIVEVTNNLFQKYECPPIKAQIGKVTPKEGHFLVKLTFIGTTLPIQKKLRLMCRELWNEQFKAQPEETPLSAENKEGSP